jgi:hypothetical protein
MSTTVEDAQAAVADAKTAVDRAETDLPSGRRSISADALHLLRDGWRHADLTAQRTRQAAEEERRSARLKGLEGIGAEVDKLAQSEHTEQLDGDALLDNQTFYDRVTSMDPDSPGYRKQVQEIVATATATEQGPAAQAAPAAPAAPPGPQQWTMDDVDKSTPSELTTAMEAGLLRDLGYAPRRRR